MALPVSPQPPVNEAPMASDGQHTQAWSQYHQKVSDSLAALSTVRVGTTTNDNAAAGQIGEYITTTGVGVSLSNGTVANVTSIALTAGDWDVSGNVTFTPAPTTHPAALGASCSATSGALGTVATLIQTTFAVGQPNSFDAGSTRFSLAATTTVYLVAVAFFTTAGMAATGSIAARRAR